MEFPEIVKLHGRKQKKFTEELMLMANVIAGGATSCHEPE
jgi:hypothetical protein